MIPTINQENKVPTLPTRLMLKVLDGSKHLIPWKFLASQSTQVMTGFLTWTPHPVMVIIRDNRDYIRVLSYS